MVGPNDNDTLALSLSLLCVVCTRDHFSLPGKSALTDAFNNSEDAVLTLLLEHPSSVALESQQNPNARVVEREDDVDGDTGGTAAAAERADSESKPDGHTARDKSLAGSAAAPADALQSTVVQAYTHTMRFRGAGPSLLVREIGTNWFGEVFTEHAEDDTTGIQLWAASLVMAR